jgi:hypothetical protein
VAFLVLSAARAAAHHPSIAPGAESLDGSTSSLDMAGATSRAEANA